MTEQKSMISVSVMYATLQQVWSVQVKLPAETATVAKAIAQAQQSPAWPSIDIDSEQLAIFGQTAQLSNALHEGDRVEILRPLLIDPMDARRGRASNKKKK